ncbi:YheC/YheD family protein [Aquibacillus kalidii]|uniref:YheC/YheD family protein n=1 Tax=Aquibacillus kalidii TaxID=2762597 RepID=UPI001645C2F9|nr:YheC/YheD family protein [Aquibacillus kalidii]
MDNSSLQNTPQTNNKIHFDKERLYFNKWEMYKLLAPHSLPFKIPYTEYFSGPALYQFVFSQTPFFIKPVDTWAGRNISLITPMDQGFLLKHPNGSTEFHPTVDAFMHNMLGQYSKYQTIIQQRAPILSYDSRAFDIRIHLQRDKHGNWVNAGDLVRIGGKDAIVSNFLSKGGGIVETDFILGNLFDHYYLHTIIENLSNSAFAIANLLDQYYPFIDIGADFGIDPYANLWLLEVNTNDRNGRPGYDLFKKLPNKTTYKQMIARDKDRTKAWKKQKKMF